MRPSSTRRSTPSSATVAPNALRRPRASMVAMRSMLLRGAGCDELLRRQAEALDGRANARPLLVEEPLAFRLKQQRARAGIHKHAQPSPFLHELLIDKLLIGLQDGQRIDAVFGGNISHRR